MPASAELAARLMADAHAHLKAAEAVVDIDPAGCLQVAYDAARKAAGALLAVQGLRATNGGGHIAVQEAARACSPAFAPFARMRRRRHDSESPGPGTPTIVGADAVEGIRQASEMVWAAADLLASGKVRAIR